jgi:hypothetical protein
MLEGVVKKTADNYVTLELVVSTKICRLNLILVHIRHTGDGKIMETLGNSFVLATMKELPLATLNVLPFVYVLSARVSALLIVSNGSPCERIGKWEICPILKEDRSLVRV